MAYAAYSASYAKLPPPKAAQKLTKQRDMAEYADFAVRGVHVPTAPVPVRVDGKHRDQVKSIAFSRSGRVVATGGLDRTVRFWDVGYRREKGKEAAGNEVSFVYNATRSPLLPSSATAAAPSDAASSSASTKATTTTEAPILRLAFSPTDEHLLAIAVSSRVAGRDRDKREVEGPAVVLWDVDPINPHAIASFPLDGEFQSVAFHPTGLALAVACFRRSAWDAVVFLWDEEAVWRRHTREAATSGAEEGEGEGMQADAEETRAEEQPARRWAVRKDIKLGDRNYRLQDRRGREWGVRELNGLCFSPDGRRLYAGETSGNIFAWEYPAMPAPRATAAPVDPANGHAAPVDGADVAMSDGLLASDLKPGGLGAEQDSAAGGTDTAAPSAAPSRQGSPVHGGDGRGGSPPIEERDDEGRVDAAGADAGRDEEVNPGESSEKAVVDDSAPEVTELDPVSSAPEQATGADEAAPVDADSKPASPDRSPPRASSPAKEAKGGQEQETDVAMGDAADEAQQGDEPASPAAALSPAQEAAATPQPQDEEQAVKSPAKVEPEIPTIIVDADGDTEMKTADSSAAASEVAAPVPGSAKTETAAPAPAPQLVAEPVKPKTPEIPATMLKYLVQVGCHSGCANCLEMSPDGRFVATGGSEGVVNQIDLSSWITVRAYDSYTEEVRNVKCSYDGEWIAVAGDDRCIDIMSVVSGTTAIRIPTKTKVECMAWVPIRSKSVLCYSLEDHISGAAGQAGDWFWVEM